MNNIFSYYTKYRNHIDEYKQWSNEQVNAPNSSLSANSEKLKQKAKAIAEPILLLDSYTHEKAEDAETFYQTYNTELMSVTAFLCTLPLVLSSKATQDFLVKHADKNTLIKQTEQLTKRYANKSFNVLGKNIKLPHIATAISAIGSGLFFAKGIKSSIEGQLGLTRKASYDATKMIAKNHNMFAILTPEQEKELNSILNHNKEHKTAFVDKLKDKIDIRSSFQSVQEYNKTNAAYKKEKTEYFEEINTIPNKKLSATQLNKAKEEQQLFQNLLKNIEHDVLEPLRKVETMANIGYSALFAGGFLEYLITDKLVEVLKVKNKPLQYIMKLGVPILTYLLLNKNISDFENKAILATKYKHLKRFMDSPEIYNYPQEQEKNIIEFIKTVAKDMKDYDTFAEKELPKIKERLEAKQQIQLTKEQEKEAKLLQKNTTMVYNTHKENFFNQTVGIEALSEIITNPVDILGAAVGAKVGNMLAHKCNHKYKGLMTAIGTIVGFIPIAIMEAKFTKEQKTAEKIASMLSIKDLKDIRKFADYTDNTYSQLLNNNKSSTFKEITSKFV